MDKFTYKIEYGSRNGPYFTENGFVLSAALTVKKLERLQELETKVEALNSLPVFELETTGRPYMETESMEKNGEKLSDEHAFGYVDVEDVKKIFEPIKKDTK